MKLSVDVDPMLPPLLLNVRSLLVVWSAEWTKKGRKRRAKKKGDERGFEPRKFTYTSTLLAGARRANPEQKFGESDPAYL